MTRDILLTITSLFSILLMTFHISDEIARGMEHGGLNMVIPVLIMAGWLYGTLVLAGRRWAGSGHPIRVFTGVLSLAFGVWLIYQIGWIEGLFRAVPHWDPH